MGWQERGAEKKLGIAEVHSNVAAILPAETDQQKAEKREES